MVFAAAFAMTFGIADAAMATTAVVLNSDDDTLSVIDSETYKEISRTHIGRGPHHLIQSPDGHTLIIAMSGSNELVLIDRTTGLEKQRVTASDPYQIGFK